MSAGADAALGLGKRQRSAGEAHSDAPSKRPRPGTAAADPALTHKAKSTALAISAVNTSAAEAGAGRLAEAGASAAGEAVVRKRKARPAAPDASPSSGCAAEAGPSVAAAAKKKHTAGLGAAARASGFPGSAASAPVDRAGAGAASVAPRKGRAPVKAAGKARGAQIGPGAAAGAAEEVAAVRAAHKAQGTRKAANRKASVGGAEADALGGVPTDPERKAAWLARVAELAARRKPTDKPLPRPMRVALKQKLREDKRAALRQHAEARWLRVTWNRR